jgi:hypothetical protein
MMYKYVQTTRYTRKGHTHTHTHIHTYIHTQYYQHQEKFRGTATKKRTPFCMYTLLDKSEKSTYTHIHIHTHIILQISGKIQGDGDEERDAILERFALRPLEDAQLQSKAGALSRKCFRRAERLAEQEGMHA